MRAVLLLAAACFSLCAAFTGVVISVDQRDEVRGIVDATSEPDLPYRVQRFGVNADLFQYDDSELLRQLELMQAANVNWIRQIIDRSQLPDDASGYQWDEISRILDALSDFPDMQLLPVLLDSTGPPETIEPWLQFIGSFAERHEDHVTYYQVWDEPNLTAAWGDEPPNITAYADLLCQSYAAIHDADASAEVIAAALAPTVEQGPDNISDIAFLDGLYRTGARDCFDAVAAKPYGFSSSPLERVYDTDTLNFSRVVLLREVMLRHNDGARALWASNFGWNRLPGNWDGAPSIWGNVSAHQQIDFTLNAIQRAEAEWPWLGGLILHHWQPNAPANDPIQGFGVIDPQNNITPLYEALVTRGVPDTATNGLWHPVNPYAQYAGVWTFSPLGADIGWLETSDSRAEFDFLGTEISLKVREGDYFAFLYPQVDDHPANALPADNVGNSYLLLRSEDDTPQLSLIKVAEALENAAHTLSFTADRGWDQWALAGYAVGTGNPAQQVEEQIFASSIVLLVSILAVVGAFCQQPIVQRTSYLKYATRKLGTISHISISLIASLALMLGMYLTWNDSIPALLRRDTVQIGISAVLSAGLLLLNPGLIITLFALMILFWFFFLDLRNGLYSVLLWASFFLFPIELYTYAFPVVELLLLILVAAALLRGLMWLGQELKVSTLLDILVTRRFRFTLPDAAVLLLVVGGALALFWSERLGYALTDYRTLFLEPALFYLILRLTPLTKQDYQRLATALIASGLLVAVIGLILFLLGDATITAEEGSRRLASVYGSPNNVGLYLERCLPFIMSFALVTRQRYKRIAFSAIGLILLLAILLTQSAAAIFIGVPASVIAVLSLTRKKQAILPLAGLIVVLLIGSIALAQTSPRFASLLDPSRGTNFIRLRVWESSIDLVAANPLTGIGLDQFLYEYRAEHVRPDAIWDPDLSHPHNIVLDFWLRLGVWGIITLAAYVTVFVLAIVRGIRMPEEDVWRIVIIGAVGALSAQFAHGLVDNSIFVVDLAIVSVFLLAILADGVFQRD